MAVVIKKRCKYCLRVLDERGLCTGNTKGCRLTRELYELEHANDDKEPEATEQPTTPKASESEQP